MKRPGCIGLLRFLSFNSSKLTKPKCPLRTPRLFSVSASPNCPINDAPVRQWALEVNPFSTVRAQLGCSISVHPLDPHTFPGADRAFVTVHGAETEQQLGPEHFMVSYDERSKELLISAQEVSSSVSVDLAAPIKSSECPLVKLWHHKRRWSPWAFWWFLQLHINLFLSDLFITTRGKGSVQVKKMECDICRVQTEEGNCLLHSVKVGGSLIKNDSKVLRKLKMFVYNPLLEFILEYLSQVKMFMSPTGVKMRHPPQKKNQTTKISDYICYCRFQGHEIEVKSEGGHVTGVGTIHGNVDISTRGYSVRTVSRGQQMSYYAI